MRVAVLGCGVVGLTAAVELSRSADVSVLYDRPLLETTSAIATAIWHVYLVDPNDTRVLRWAQRSLERYLDIATHSPEAGVSLVTGVELFRKSKRMVPPWWHIPPRFRLLDDTELRIYPGARWGYEICAPLADMYQYLPWLSDRARTRGVQFVEGHVARMEDLAGAFDVVVNCTGLRAREILRDDGLQPVRGQYLVLERGDDCPAAYVGDDDNPGGMSFAIPRCHDICVGGTEEYGVESLEFEADEAAMIRRAGELFPWLRAAGRRVLRRVVGLRPFRAAGVRLELETSASGIRVVHNYGHGGSGFSLAWGCAADVRTLVERIGLT